MNIHEFWKAVLVQDENEIRKYFHEDAYVNWHCTNEHFNLDEYIIANCEYPGEWAGEVERLEKAGDLNIMAVHVHTKDDSLSFHVVSFIRMDGDKIGTIDEYWGDDGPVPKWRKEKEIGIRFPESSEE